MDNFVSSRSMITPGLAGSATTMITGTLVTTFGFPGAVTALIVSFVFGLMALADKSVAAYYKFIFYIINSVTIFSVAVGLNQAGMAIIERDRQAPTVEERTLGPAEDEEHDAMQAESRPFFQEWF
ncbi:hypothetical protein SAMN05421690_1004111 [Nitrosomonas sp. Nm51]|uniref:hypothetical protein n=1 Tax=Nitrosomonas sp. Nm51 TaxID=133720 RepID=UPI0008C7794D|nr:hypothetical protein [Nitrosomonas sp. Nm51]SEQ96876.1 hypothetical protein SAMN05421690_1004111 [Nitrosomonas sp. Nm51]